MPKRPYESQRMPYRDYQRSRYNVSMGYPLASPYRTGYFRRGYNPGPPYVSSYRRFWGLRKYPGSGIETKFFDTFLAAAAISVPAASTSWTGMEQNPATVLCLNAPTQGTGASNREGRLITMESIQIQGVCSVAPQIDQTAADTAPIIRIWLVLDKQTNGGTATGLDSENVYTNPAGTQIGGTMPLRNMLYSKRYKVLKEWDVDFKNLTFSYDGTNMEQSGAQISFEGFIPLKGRKVEFFGNAGTVADITTNGLFVLACCSSGQYAPSLTYNARLRFRG